MVRNVVLLLLLLLLLLFVVWFLFDFLIYHGSVSIYESFPPGIQFQSIPEGCRAEDASYPYNYTCRVGSAPYDMVVGTQATFFFSFYLAPSTPPGIITNVANVTSPTPDPDECNNVAVLPSLVCVESDLGVTKTDGQLQVTAGQRNANGTGLQVFTYTFVGTNYGPSDARNIVFTDVWPVGNPSFILEGIRGVPGNNYTVTSTGFSVQFPYLAVGQNVTFYADFTVPPCMVACEACNAVSIRSDSPDPGPRPNVAVDCDQVRTEADLSVCKTDGVSSVTAGLLDANGNAVQYRYTIEVCNNGPSCAQKVQLIDYFPPEVIRLLGTLSAEQGSCTDVSVPGHPRSFSCNLLTLNPGQCTNVYVSFTVPGNVTTCAVTNIAKVWSLVTFDPQLCNNQAEDVDAVIETASLQISKTPATQTIVYGDFSNYTWTITVWNQGPSVARDVIVSDLWPMGAIPYPEGLVTSQGVVYRQQSSSFGDFTIAVGDLRPGAANRVTITAPFSIMHGMGPGDIVNQATAFSPTDPDGCRTANATVRLVAPRRQPVPEAPKQQKKAAPQPSYREVHAPSSVLPTPKPVVVDSRLSPLHAEVSVAYENVTGVFSVVVSNPNKVTA
jgi:uncharacterized repeat protein (TIGR01451 family)